ncbi:peptidylprolyl isomerase [Cohnella yongneupensis]|uniref:peptidylprolyl isomerase n=1 Tax=Cohnella yongneupensis TaxID=425006 RepID=A0ABW0R6I8_9BACL
MGKSLLIFIAAIAVSCTFFVTVGYMKDKDGGSGVVATVDDEPITVKELMPKLIAHRSEVLAYFKNKYNAIPGVGFWTSSFDGEIPSEMLKKAALDECVAIKVQQIAGKEKGLVKDISYSQFLKDLKKENARRKTAIENKKVIYGPEQYTEAVYFSILFSDLVHKLKGKADERLIVSEEEIKQYYDNAIKENKYKKAGKVKVEKISFAFTAGDDKSKKAAEEMAEEVRKQFANGHDFKNLSDLDGNNAEIKVQFGEQIFDSTTIREDYMPATHEFTEQAIGLSIGQVSEVFEYNNAYYVVKSIEKTDEGFNNLDEVNESIKQLLQDKKYNSYVDNLVKHATVVIYNKVYRKLELY